MIPALSTRFPTFQSFKGQIMDLPADLLTPIVVQLSGGEGISDITLWKHACKLAQTCVGFREAVLAAPVLRDVEFRGELVGDAAPEGEDDTKESLLQVHRTRFKPEITMVFRYGNRAIEFGGPHGTVISEAMLSWTRPLDLDEVLSTFATPPGWKSAAKLTISGKDAPPWSGCFPIDKLPESGRTIPTICRFSGVNSRLRFSHEEMLLDTKQKTKTRPLPSWNGDAVAMNGLVVAMCSTGIEEFKRGQRAHYLEDLEIGLTTGIPQAVLNNLDMRHALGIDPHEPPDLYYRFKPEEARRLAGYDVHDRQRVYDLLYPPKPVDHHKKRWVRLDHEDSNEEWDPDARKRQKEAARAKMRLNIMEFSKDESFGISNDDMIPMHKSKKKKVIEDVDSDPFFDSDSDDEAPAPPSVAIEDTDPFSDSDDEAPAPPSVHKAKKKVIKDVESDLFSDSDDEAPAPPPPPPPVVVHKPKPKPLPSRLKEGALKDMECMYGYPLNITRYGLNREWDAKLRMMWQQMQNSTAYASTNVKTRLQYLHSIAECAALLKQRPCVHADLGVVNGGGVYAVEMLVVSHTAKWRSHCLRCNMRGNEPLKTLDRWYTNILKMIALCGPSMDLDDDLAWSSMEPGGGSGAEEDVGGVYGMPHNE